MRSQQWKEEHITKSSSIPYMRIIEALKSALQVCQPKTEKVKIQPNRFVLHLSPDDRKAREKYEDILIDEITRDILHLYTKVKINRPLQKLRIEMRTEKRLTAGRIRVECYQDECLLYRFDQEEDTSFKIETDGPFEEWTALDILPKDSKVGKSILVVDDEPVLCAVLQRMLAKLDYHVVTAHNGLEAIKVLSHMEIDMVITDLRMPEMDGWELMRYVKQELPNLPVILITGYHSLYTEARATEHSADGYISKPFSFTQIKELVESVMSVHDDTVTSITHISR